MLGKQVVTNFFEKHSIHHIFHLPGIHTLSLDERLIKADFETYIGRHESNIAYMADGFARASGKAGVVIVTPGPGLGNMVSGCMEAYGDDVPLLIIHVDTGRRQIGKGILHEVVDPENIFRHITKAAIVVHGPGDLSSGLEMAYHTATMGRPGPVLISIPYTLFEKEIAQSADLCPAPKAHDKEADLTSVEKTLQGKRRPIIIGGKSLMTEEAGLLIDEICSTFSIPFLTSTGGKGIVREDAPYAMGNVLKKGVEREVMGSSDVVLAVGTRLRDVDAKRRGVKIRDLVHIDIDGSWIGKNYPAASAVSGDLVQALRGLKEILRGNRFDWDLETLQKTRKEQEKSFVGHFTGYKMIRMLRKVIPEDTVMVCDLNLPSYWAEYYFPVYRQNSFLMPRGISPIFYALPASIGAGIGRPEQPCLCIAGDGGGLAAIAELSTIRKYNIPVVLLIHNNNSFGILEDYMETTYNIKGSMELVNPDFVKVAAAFDIRAKKAKSLEGLQNVFLHHVTWDEPFVIEYCCPVFPPPWRA